MTSDIRDELRAAGAEYQACRTSLASATDHLLPLVIAALREGVGVVEVARLSGYTRENVRVIARKNDVKSK